MKSWNTLSGPTARRKPKPAPLLEHVPDPTGQERDAIEWQRLKLVACGSHGRPGAVRARIRLVEFTAGMLRREIG